MNLNGKIVDPLFAGDPLVVHQGGTSSGKTYGIMQYLLLQAARNENEIITVVAEDVPNLKAGAYRDAQSILADNEPLRRCFRDTHNKSDRNYTGLGGSVIEFKSFQDEIDARSGKRNRLFVNEANGVKYGIYEQLALRTTDQVIIDFNPSARFWAHDNLEGREGVTWVVSTYRDNEFLHPEIEKKIKLYEPTPENIKRGTANEYRWQVYGLGQVGRLEGLVFPNWQTGAFPEEYKWRVFGMDFGYTNDPTTLIEVRLHEGALWWKQHLYKTGLTNPEISDELYRIAHPKNELIVADSAEPKSIEEIKRMGWNIKGAVKGPGSVNQRIDAIKRYPLYIDPMSKDLIEEFSSYTWKVDRDGRTTNDPVDAFNHGIDAGGYGLSTKILSERKPLQTSMIDW